MEETFYSATWYFLQVYIVLQAGRPQYEYSHCENQKSSVTKLVVLMN
jgi:hypothetical protein